MTKLTLDGKVVADFPVIYLGDMIAIADQVEKVNTLFAEGRDNIVSGLRAVQPILDIVNTLLAHRGEPVLTIELNKLPRNDVALVINFYFELLMGAGLSKGEEKATTIQSSVAQPSPVSANHSESVS